MLAATIVRMSSSEKKSEQEHIKRLTRKFLEVSRCSRAEQQQRNVLKMCAARAKLLLLCFLSLIRLTNFFDCFRWRRRLALHDFIFSLSKL